MSLKTENLAIVLTDIAGYTGTTQNQSRQDNARLLSTHNRILLPIIRRYKGRHVKSIGDALLMVFRSPTDAMPCAMAMQDALFEFNRSAPREQQIHIRAAASLGEVRVTRSEPKPAAKPAASVAADAKSTSTAATAAARPYQPEFKLTDSEAKRPVAANTAYARIGDAKKALKENKLDKDNSKKVVAQLETAMKKEIDQAKSDYKTDKIGKQEYKARVDLIEKKYK